MQNHQKVHFQGSPGMSLILFVEHLSFELTANLYISALLRLFLLYILRLICMQHSCFQYFI